MTSSRLDRLFVLLESGSSAVTRSAAAKQLGEVQRLYPHELHTLLARITTYLRSPNWDTRIAAGEAVRAVLSNVPPWRPQGTENEPEEDIDTCLARLGRLRFSQLDMDKVLASSVHLTGSEGKEYDLEEDICSGDLKERITKQRQMLNARLGLDVASKLGMDTSDIYTNDDLSSMQSTATIETQEVKRNISEVFSRSLSSRERNRAKRKARQGIEEPEKKKPKSENASASVSSEDTNLSEIENAGTPDVTGSWSTDATEWPLEWFCEQLYQDLLSASWETRHGAATALRELIRACGSDAGYSHDIPKSQQQRHHEAWLEDSSVRFLCVLALDRFGDFVSDAVVAPVRETCAQCLAAVLAISDSNGVLAALEIITKLMGRSEWEARHGGLLAVKYVLAVRSDLAGDLVPRVLPHCVERLADQVDDVGAVAAAALVPVAEHLVELLPQQVPVVVNRLWELLAEQDELAAACNSFMALLAALLGLPQARSILPVRPLGEIVPRLWPFLAHSTSTVRRATLTTLDTLTSTDIAKNHWPAPLLQDALRHVFQRALLEPLEEIQVSVERVWGNLLKNSDLAELLHAACPYVSTWLCLTMHPARVPLDPTMLVSARTARNQDAQILAAKYYLGGNNADAGSVVRTRITASRMLGLLSCYVVQPAPGVTYAPDTDSPVDCYVKVMLAHLMSKSAQQRTVAGLVLAEWAKLDSGARPCHPALQTCLHTCLAECVYFDEIAAGFTRLLQETNDFVAMLRHYKVPINDPGSSGVLTLDRMRELSGEVTQQALTKVKLKPKVSDGLEQRRRGISASVEQTTTEQCTLSVRALSVLAGAAIRLAALPDKLNPVVKPLMEAIKREQDERLQKLAAEHLAILLDICRDRNPCPNEKILNNLCTFLRSDEDFAPKIPEANDRGIITLEKQQKWAERAVGRNRGPGRPPLVSEVQVEDVATPEDEAKTHANRTQRRGATFALQHAAMHFSNELASRLPRLWSLTVLELTSAAVDASPENLLGLLLVFEAVAPSVTKSMLNELITLSLPKLCTLLAHECNVVRHLAARCLAALSRLDAVRVMERIVTDVIPMLDASDSEVKRQGSVEALSSIVDALQLDIVPYVVVLVVPLLGRMSDQDRDVRLMATRCFATLVQLMPLDGAVPEPESLAQCAPLKERRDRERAFLRQLLSPATVVDYQLPIPVSASLRPYQRAGVNWLAFLNRYKLHGILCDDMGLGKTLQSICMLAADHFTREQRYKLTTSADSVPLPSIVICPPTLTGHWVYEVDKFVSRQYLRPLQYAGTPTERNRLKRKLPKHNLVVASYDIVRKDISFFGAVKWNYCVLDEGHVIKNGKTRTSLAVKMIQANHRIILSGTPIQNNVLELWSLFDFLMPGFLGTEKQFTARYSRPILASREPKCGAREQEAGALAMEALHRQVLPFLLRRMKEDVLADLPPKITQDYYCELSALQQQLYDDFSRSQAHQSIQDCLHEKSTTPTASAMQANSHVFQALRYLQNVCNHPKLVLTPQHPRYVPIVEQLGNSGVPLDDISHSAKLPALKQLLDDCGIGQPDSTDLDMNQHRALVFCQLKAMLDIIEGDLFRKHLPALTYLRLDGSVPSAQRHAIVHRFNTDPSIEVLLLTTHVGGLGLNLTGADTVIFVEHDWNPMRDLQAMDRAHRIGQRKVVNVYRLVTRATLEEKIMGLQKFKVHTANTVIGRDNSRIDTMGTGQLLDLFSRGGDVGCNAASGNVSKNVLDSLPELWDDKQYDDEYDLTQFLEKLRN